MKKLLLILLFCLYYLLAHTQEMCHSLSFHVVDSVLPSSSYELLNIRKEISDSCNYCFNMYSKSVRSKPFLIISQLDSVNWQKQQYYFNDSIYEMIRHKMIPKYGVDEIEDSLLSRVGIPVIMKLDGKSLGYFWVYMPPSSVVCDVSRATLYKNSLLIYTSMNSYKYITIDVNNLDKVLMLLEEYKLIR